MVHDICGHTGVQWDDGILAWGHHGQLSRPIGNTDVKY